MWAYFCWLQKSCVCCLILKTMPSCPGLTPTQDFTIRLTAGSLEHSPLHQWKASRGGHLHFKENTFSKSANTFHNNHMQCLFLNWWHLTTLRWTDVTMDIMWLSILILTWFNDYFALRLQLYKSFKVTNGCPSSYKCHSLLQLLLGAPGSETLNMRVRRICCLNNLGTSPLNSRK